MPAGQHPRSCYCVFVGAAEKSCNGLGVHYSVVLGVLLSNAALIESRGLPLPALSAALHARCCRSCCVGVVGNTCDCVPILMPELHPHSVKLNKLGVLARQTCHTCDGHICCGEASPCAQADVFRALVRGILLLTLLPAACAWEASTAARCLDPATIRTAVDRASEFKDETATGRMLLQSHSVRQILAESVEAPAGASPLARDCCRMPGRRQCRKEAEL